MIVFLINISSFLLFVIIGSLIMCGWYKATRHKMIFAFWSKYWEARTDVDGVIAGVENRIRDYQEMKQASINSGNAYGAEMWLNRLKDAESELSTLKIKFPYKRPEFLVHPMSGCVYCYASIYGSLIFWVLGYTMNSIMGYELSLSWHPFVLWITYMLSTCAMNGILIKKVL